MSLCVEVGCGWVVGGGGCEEIRWRRPSSDSPSRRGRTSRADAGARGPGGGGWVEEEGVGGDRCGRRLERSGRLHGDGNQGHVEGEGRGLGKQRERGVGVGGRRRGLLGMI